MRSNIINREFFGGLRWPDGPVCPHYECKEVCRLTPKADSENLGGNRLFKCKKCRRKFMVTVNNFFESSHIRLTNWIMA